MTSLIQDYEQQYAVLSAEITADIGQLSRISGGKENSIVGSIICTYGTFYNLFFS